MNVQFRIEDGSGLPDATSYVSEEELRQYCVNMGYELGTLTDDQLQVLLNKATQVLDASYPWPGKRAGYQALEWPRRFASYLDGGKIEGVPQEVKNALCELCFAKSKGADVQPAVTEAVKSESVSVGPITESKHYAIPKTGKIRITAVSDALVRIVGKSSRLNVLRV